MKIGYQKGTRVLQERDLIFENRPALTIASPTQPSITSEIKWGDHEFEIFLIKKKHSNRKARGRNEHITKQQENSGIMMMILMEKRVQAE